MSEEIQGHSKTAPTQPELIKDNGETPETRSDLVDDLSYRDAVRQAMASIAPTTDPTFAFPTATPSPLLLKRQRIKGVVESAKMDKTIVVRRDLLREHPKYKKRVRSASKFYVHDEYGLAKEGDIVRIVESRPLSKTKRFVLEAILQKRSAASATMPFNPKWSQRPPLVILSIPGMRQGELQELTASHSYQVNIELELQQIKLFSQDGEGDNPVYTNPDDKSIIVTQRTDHPDMRAVELEIRFVSNRLSVEPRVGFIRTSGGRPILDPPTFKLFAKESGIADLNLSILSNRSGEVVQSQAFEFMVLRQDGALDAS